MTTQPLPADVAADALGTARASGASLEEARALGELGTALLAAGRTSEGRYLCRRAAGLADRLGERDVADAALAALGFGLAQFEELDGQWRAALLAGGDETEHFLSPAVARSAESYRTGRSSDDAFRITGSTVVELACGYVVVKFLGPFVEAFAKKLGERLGETTATAIGRLRLLRHHKHGRVELDVLTPDAPPTTLVLPADFDDVARLAAIELDVGADGIRGAELHWDAASGRWRQAEGGRTDG